jgi:hypothetical protein
VALDDVDVGRTDGNTITRQHAGAVAKLDSVQERAVHAPQILDRQFLRDESYAGVMPRDLNLLQYDLAIVGSSDRRFASSKVDLSSPDAQRVAARRVPVIWALSSRLEP